VIARIGTLLALIAIWWFLSLDASGLGLPGPQAVLSSFFDMLADGRLLSALSVTLSAFAVGGILAVLVGVPLGILMGVRRWFGLALDPYLTALYVMPFSAIVPLLVLWFGIDEQVRIVFIFLFTLPQVAIVCYQGARDTPTRLVEVARTYLASDRQIFLKVLLPHELPFIFTALRLGVGLAIQGMIVSELLIASLTGIGYLLRIAGATLDLATVLAVILFVMLLGIAAVAVMQRIENSIAPWRHAGTTEGGGVNG
jgi:ABC-type nitrate/sulfonate/bicarbonate transport system permease component